MKDDLAIVVALAASELAKQPPEPAVMYFGTIEDNQLGLIPDSCQYHAGCGNSPRCVDLGDCQGFKNNRVSA
jgi:hypothetical protein